jgi:hypothetical protein
MPNDQAVRALANSYITWSFGIWYSLVIRP